MRCERREVWEKHKERNEEEKKMTKSGRMRCERREVSEKHEERNEEEKKIVEDDTKNFYCNAFVQK